MDQVAESVERESEGPWPVPEGWSWAEAQAFADIVGGGTPSDAADPANFDPGGIPWLTPADLSGFSGSTIRRGARSLSPIGVKRSSSQMLPAGSVLISSRAPVGYCVVADVPICTNQGFKSLRLKAPIDPFFLRYFVLFAKRRLNDAASGTTFKELSGRAMEQILFPLAPLAEQRRIVARVDALFAEIAEGEAALDAARKRLDTFRRALLKAAVTGELTKDWRENNPITETGHDLLARIRATRAAKGQAKGRGKRSPDAPPLDTAVLPELPEGWAWGTVRDIADVMGGLTKNPDREKMAGRAKYLRVANVQAGSLDLTEMKEIGVTAEDRQRASLQPGDLLVVEGNGSIDQIGRCALWDGEIADCVHQNHIIKVRFSDPSLLPRWCFKWLLSPHGRQEIEQVAASTSGLHTLSISKIEALPIPIPPPAEAAEILRRVAQALAASADTLAMLDAEAADAARLKQSILKAAFEGRLVPQDPTDEPASAMLARLKATSSPATPARRGRRAKS